MKLVNWDREKNIKLIAERNISFEVVTRYIENEDILEILEHPNQEKYPNQKIFVIDIVGYINLVPFVETDKKNFS
jgi:predicted nucleic acid-binding protein